MQPRKPASTDTPITASNAIRPEDKAFGERIAWVIKHIFGSVHRASVALDIQSRSLQRYASGAVLPSIDALRQIQRAGVCLEWLISGDGDPFCDCKAHKRTTDTASVMIEPTHDDKGADGDDTSTDGN